MKSEAMRPDRVFIGSGALQCPCSIDHAGIRGLGFAIGVETEELEFSCLDPGQLQSHLRYLTVGESRPIRRAALEEIASRFVASSGCPIGALLARGLPPVRILLIGGWRVYRIIKIALEVVLFFEHGFTHGLIENDGVRPSMGKSDIVGDAVVFSHTIFDGSPRDYYGGVVIGVSKASMCEDPFALMQSTARSMLTSDWLGREAIRRRRETA